VISLASSRRRFYNWMVQVPLLTSGRLERCSDRTGTNEAREGVWGRSAEVGERKTGRGWERDGGGGELGGKAGEERKWGKGGREGREGNSDRVEVGMDGWMDGWMDGIGM
jgi:hypothetical protein